MEAVSLSPSQAPQESADPSASIGSGFKEYAPLAEKFGMDGRKLAPNVERNLSMIWKWASEHAETKDRDAILWQVTKLSNRMGDAPYGSAPYSKVLNYISTYNTMKESENRLKEMEGHGRD